MFGDKKPINREQPTTSTPIQKGCEPRSVRRAVHRACTHKYTRVHTHAAMLLLTVMKRLSRNDSLRKQDDEQ